MSSHPKAWSPELDALIAAPNHHRLAMENERVRVLETRIEPGQTVPLHTHANSSANFILSWSTCIRRNAAGEVMFDSKAAGVDLQPGEAIWSGPYEPHTLENTGDRAIHIVSVEVK